MFFSVQYHVCSKILLPRNFLASSCLTEVFRFFGKRYSSNRASADGCATSLFASWHHLHPEMGLSVNVFQSAAPSRENSTLTFDNILSQSNRQRCKDQLRDQKPFDAKNFPWLRIRNVKNMKPAAVLIPLCLVDGQPSVLFTLRSNNLPTHKGDVSFPGGAVDETDKGAVSTALRELEEEIGLKKDVVEVLGQMMPVPGANFSFLVTPVLAYCGEIDVKKLSINQNEVDEVFVGSLASLCMENNVRYTTYKSKSICYSSPMYLGQKHRIWGLTAIFLDQTLKLIAPGLYNFKYQMVR